MDRVQASSTDATDRRARKRQALRQAISDAATRLFAEHGFDAVTVDDIARAADVSRMTVFNHFPRKEDMFFDRADATIHALEGAVMDAAPQAPLAAVVQLVHALVQRRDPILEISARSVRYAATIESSPTLSSRSQVLRHELVGALAQLLEGATGRDRADPDARLAAEMTIAVWSASYATAQDVMRQTDDRDAAAAAFVAVFDKGMAGALTAFHDTPFVSDR